MSCKLPFALSLALALVVPASMRVSAAPGAADLTVRLDPVRPRWPVAREPGGEWGIVGEVVASHALPTPATIRAVTIAVRDEEGRLLAHRRYETGDALAGMLRVATAEPDVERWRPSGTMAFTSAERAVVFVAELVASRPASVAIGYDIDGQRPAWVTVPLEAYQTPQRLGWPTGFDGRPWIATGTAGTPPHSQGGALLHDGRLFISQRFALDLRQIDGQLNTHPPGTADKEAYYAWGQAVRSMARGRVVYVANGDPDLEIGAPIPSMQHPAGNHVVVQHGPAAFAVYAHLQQGSVAVAKDQWVERGQLLARVGNSGASSEPHLHVHLADRWQAASDPVAAFYLSQGLPALFWGAQVYREGVWLSLRGTTPTESDIVVPAERP